MALLFGLATVLATYLGGLFALRKSDKLHLILGFSAGAVIGVAFFDLLPEALQLGSVRYSVSLLTTLVAAGFLLFMLLSRLFLLHPHTVEEECNDHAHSGQIGAGSLALHSFLDGIGIGLAFQVSNVVGLVVGAAVLAHDFSDGINAVGLILKEEQNRTRALRWLLLDAVAPFLGVLSTRFFTLPESVLGLILAVFAGFFLYIGASDLLPESHHQHPKVTTSLLTILGAAVIYLAIHLARI